MSKYRLSSNNRELFFILFQAILPVKFHIFFQGNSKKSRSISTAP